MSKSVKRFTCILLIGTHSVSRTFEGKKLNSLGSLRKGAHANSFGRRLEVYSRLEEGKKPFSRLFFGERNLLVSIVAMK